MICPYCDCEFEQAARQPHAPELIALVCPTCSWRVTILKTPPADQPPPPPPVDATPQALCDLIGRASVTYVGSARAMLAVGVYLVLAVEAISASRDRETMRADLRDGRRVLADQLADIIQAAAGKDGAR